MNFGPPHDDEQRGPDDRPPPPEIIEADSPPAEAEAAIEATIIGEGADGAANFDRAAHLAPWDPRRARGASTSKRFLFGSLSFGFALLCVIGLLFVQLIVGVIFAVGSVALATFMGQQPADASAMEGSLTTLLVLIGTATTLAVAFVMSIVFFGKAVTLRIAWRRLSWTQLGLVVLLVLPLAVLASEVTNWASQYLPQFQLDQLMAFGLSPWPLVFFAGCLLPGVGEEIFFRGCLSRNLVAWNGVVIGALLTALLFGLVHIEPVQACGAFFLGLALQYVYLATRSLLAPIILHTLNNSLAFGAYRWREQFPVPGFSADGGDVVLHTPLLLLAAAGVATAYLLIALYRTRTRWRMLDGRDWSPGYATAESPDPRVGAVAFQQPLPWALAVGGVLAWASVVVCLFVVHDNYSKGRHINRKGQDSAPSVRPVERSLTATVVGLGRPAVNLPERAIDQAGDFRESHRLGKHGVGVGLQSFGGQHVVQPGREQDARKDDVHLLDSTNRL